MHVSKSQIWSDACIQIMELALSMHSNHGVGWMHVTKSRNLPNACTQIKELAQSMYPNQEHDPRITKLHATLLSITVFAR